MTTTKKGAAKQGHRGVPVVIVVMTFIIIACGFIASTIYGTSLTLAIDDEVTSIETNSLPSVEYLAAADSAVHGLEIETNQYAAEPPDGREAARKGLVDARDAIDHELITYLGQPMYPGEEVLYQRVARSLLVLDRVIGELTKGRDTTELQTIVDTKVHKATADVHSAIHDLSALNGDHLHKEIARITEARRRSTRTAFFLDGLCVMVSVGAAVVAVRAMRRQRELEAAHETMLQERAKELEFFAKRVAHDLLSPLSALSFTLSTVKRNIAKGMPVGEPLQRADGCLKRSQTLVEGVLDFACSSAAPAAGGMADVRGALSGVLDDVRADHRAEEIQMVVEQFEEVSVACSQGVLTSVLSNLVRNGVKYMGDPEVKEIRISVRSTPHTVRIDVKDTGPGLSGELAEHVFEPYVRAPDNDQPGLGLGLSTVRRFVEAHGGRVGVESTLGKGSTFWFELPRVRSRESTEDSQVLRVASRVGEERW